MDKKDLNLRKPNTIFLVSHTHQSKPIFNVACIEKRKRKAKPFAIENQGKMVVRNDAGIEPAAHRAGPVQSQPNPRSTRKPPLNTLPNKLPPDHLPAKINPFDIRQNTSLLRSPGQVCPSVMPPAAPQNFVNERILSISSELQAISLELAADYPLCQNLAVMDSTMLGYWHSLRAHLVTLNQAAQSILSLSVTCLLYTSPSPRD
eukprot:TRINITY_DN2849_c0_g1_i3.p1 TRINITY_DN2849_c0_g1~~TRINITY_DN2849_c0_g1_i3.p1  ORF type:complete len:204 (-),score=1.33 TRINITY_DN2849_c0_g1_i3:53-664(-)